MIFIDSSYLIALSIKSDKNKRICDSVCAIFAYTAEGGKKCTPQKIAESGTYPLGQTKLGKKNRIYSLGRMRKNTYYEKCT